MSRKMQVYQYKTRTQEESIIRRHLSNTGSGDVNEGAHR
jgi:hypothetical protein